MPAPSLDELRHLFAGVWIHDLEQWETTPSYQITLALEICRRCDCRTDDQLRRVIYSTLPANEVPGIAEYVIELAVQRYRRELDLAVTGALA